MILADSATSVIVVVIIIGFGGLVQSSIGFGYAIAVLPLLAWVMEPRAAHVLVSISGVAVLAMSAWTCREGFQWAVIWPALIGGTAAIPLGTLLFASLSPSLLIRVTGVVILAMLLWDFKAHRSEAPRRNQWASFWAGAVSGFLAGAVSIGGPPVATFALKQRWSPLQFKAFVVWFLLLTSFVKVIALGVSGFLVGAGVWLALVSSPFAVIGVVLGSRLSRQVDPHRFRRMISLILMAIAILMIFQTN
ncbi:MAG: sulfite exporter TauE/SafE family protein [Planctomycetaceae bacterium]